MITNKLTSPPEHITKTNFASVSKESGGYRFSSDRLGDCTVLYNTATAKKYLVPDSSKYVIIELTPENAVGIHNSVTHRRPVDIDDLLTAACGSVFISDDNKLFIKTIDTNKKTMAVCITDGKSFPIDNMPFNLYRVRRPLAISEFT